MALTPFVDPLRPASCLKVGCCVVARSVFALPSPIRHCRISVRERLAFLPPYPPVLPHSALQLAEKSREEQQMRATVYAGILKASTTSRVKGMRALGQIKADLVKATMAR